MGVGAGEVHPEALKFWRGWRHKPLLSRGEGAVHPFSVRILAGEPGTDTKNSFHLTKHKWPKTWEGGKLCSPFYVVNKL